VGGEQSRITPRRVRRRSCNAAAEPSPDPIDVTANSLLWCLGAYATAGLLFAVPFALRGIDRLDPAAHGASWGFRLIIVPAAVLLWPVLLRRILAGRHEPPSERNVHDRAATDRDPMQPEAVRR
jgi:hypothetical protein